MLSSIENRTAEAEPVPVGLPGSQVEGSSCCSTSWSGNRTEKNDVCTLPTAYVAALEVSANFGLSGSLAKILQPGLAFLGAFLGC